MDHKVHKINNKEIIEIKEKGVVIKNSQDLLDLIANLHSRKIVLHKENLDESFFDLKSGFAGEILQKASNYSVQIGIIGNFTNYKSKSLQAFIYESNKINQIIFVESLDEVLQRFGK